MLSFYISILLLLSSKGLHKRISWSKLRPSIQSSPPSLFTGYYLSIYLPSFLSFLPDRQSYFYEALKDYIRQYHDGSLNSAHQCNLPRSFNLLFTTLVIYSLLSIYLSAKLSIYPTWPSGLLLWSSKGLHKKISWSWW